MIQIKPVSDLRNKFPDIEKIVNEVEPVYLTKNGYGVMVVLSLDAYSRLTDGISLTLALGFTNLNIRFIVSFASFSVSPNASIRMQKHLKNRKRKDKKKVENKNSVE